MESDMKSQKFSLKDSLEKRDRMKSLGASFLVSVTEDILIKMEALNITKSMIAQKLKTSKSHISQVLSGSRNMTLKTVSDIYYVLGYVPNIELKKINDATIAPLKTTTHTSFITKSESLVVVMEERDSTASKKDLSALVQARIESTSWICPQ